MFRPDIDLVRVIHAERVDRDLAAVRVARVPRHSMRRLVGRSIVRVGSWVAAEPNAEPNLEPVRSS
jgi:hypothetical protein